MTPRRDFLMGGLCLAGAGAAYALIPRRRVSLLGPVRLADVVPREVDAWTSRDVTDLVAPKEEGSLASRLYGETVGRVYRHGSSGVEIMMLLAHGDTQSDDLQLHRPEICYPAFGFSIQANRSVGITLVKDASIPSRSLIAEAPDRRETILYWSRLGEFFPTTRKEQHLDRTRTAMKGEIADGLLARFSISGGDPVEAAGAMQTFIPILIKGVSAAHRPALIGTALARRMASAGV